jgi:energy-coupling factor transport system ATP-binding protein
MITIRDLRYRYPGRVTWTLQGVDLAIAPGEYVLLCGASGAGKSTLCRTFNGLIPHYFYGGVLEGCVQVAGLDTRVHPVSELFASVALVAQNPEAQLFNRTVEHELAFGLESLGLPRHEIRRRVAESADLVGIADLLERNPRRLSGGEQHLVMIATAVALQPRVLVLDEPYANLDPANVRRVRAALRAINRHGTAIVLSEHRLHHAIADASRMVVLHQGRIVRNGPPRTVLREDLAAFGLSLPPVVCVARELGLSAVPLSVEELAAAAQGCALPPGLLPERRGDVPAGPSLLQLEQVSFAYGPAPVLRDIHLEVRAGEVLALVGANGAGKTTLIKHFNGLHRPARGRVVVLGRDTRRAKVSQLARQVGLAFQNPNDQFFTFRVWDEIAVGARALGCCDEGWLQELARLFGLEPLLERPPYRLSEGEKKRVAFAAALAARPTILVLDEPTAGQDWAFRRALGGALSELRARGYAIVLVTHDLEFAEQHADRWALMADGALLATGHPWQVMADAAAMQRAGLEPTQAFQIAAACGWIVALAGGEMVGQAAAECEGLGGPPAIQEQPLRR